MRWVATTWVEADLDDSWRLAIRVVPQNGEPVVAEVRVFPKEADRPGYGEWSGVLCDQSDVVVPPGGLRARTLREVRLGVVRSTYRETVAFWRKVEEKTGEPLLSDVGWDFTPAAGRRRRQPDSFYAAVAATHVEAILDGSRHPNVAAASALAAMWGREVTANQVRAWVEEARRRKLLDHPRRGAGSIGGGITAKGRAALESNSAHQEKADGEH